MSNANILADVAEAVAGNPNRPGIEVAFDGMPVHCPVLTVVDDFMDRETAVEVVQTTTPAGNARFELTLVELCGEVDELDVIVQKVADVDELTLAIWKWLDKLR